MSDEHLSKSQQEAIQVARVLVNRETMRDSFMTPDFIVRDLLRAIDVQSESVRALLKQCRELRQKLDTKESP